jgi:CO/xanthine dehydrogenase FAD-binding subunit
MAPLEYHRPSNVSEALALLPRGTPLGGGTAITPERAQIEAVIDLQSLGLDALDLTERVIIAGATLTLEGLATGCAGAAPAIAEAARLEASLNLRNMATVAGSLVAADGRSPLATTLLAAQSVIVVEPRAEEIALEDLFLPGRALLDGKIIIAIRIPHWSYLGYLQVGRSPADRPIVCAALAHRGGPSGLRGALGGYGSRPVLLEELPPDAEAAGVVAREVYSGAGDEWASAEYRSEVASVLVRRLLGEALQR